jgi:hypothetical protein
MRSYPWAISVMPNCSTIKCLPAPGVPLRASLLAAALACLVADGACAQQNPFQSLKDALNQAKQQLQPKTSSTSSAGTPAQPTNPAPSAPAAAAPMLAASSATAPTVFAPPSADGPPAAVGPIDPAKMPQINGIHLGEPLADANATLRKLYSGQGARVDALNGQSMGAQHQAWPQTLRAASDSIGSEEADVDVTYPPNAPVVWHMSRIAHQPNVAHDVLVAALRDKYGKETVALHGGSDAPVTVDRQIMEMYWVYDEQGKLKTQTKVLQHSPFNCATYGGGANFYFNMVRDAGTPPPGYCRDGYVALHISLSDTDIVNTLYFDMVDIPLAARSAHATDAWSKGLDQKAQQHTRDEAKTAQPAL